MVLDAGSFSFCENVKNDGLIKKSQVIHFESENVEHIPKVLLKCHLSIAAPFGGFSWILCVRVSSFYCFFLKIPGI